MANTESLTTGLDATLKRYHTGMIDSAALLRVLRFLTGIRTTTQSATTLQTLIAQDLDQYLTDGNETIPQLVSGLESIVEYEKQYKDTWEYETA
jgi:hypothetical protein